MSRGKKRLSLEEELLVSEYEQTKKNKQIEHTCSKIKQFKPKTEKQKQLIKLIREKEVVMCIGPSGSGKTFCALATALDLLKEGYEKIILIKSVTTLPEEEVGYIPGSIGDKMEPFMMSYTWNIDKILGNGEAKKLISAGTIQVLPLAFVRGITIDDSIVLLDESQNFSDHTFKTIMTRIGSNSKYIFLGDIEQVDKKKKSDSCLARVLDIFKDSDIIGTIKFTDDDCVRNPIIPPILAKLREYDI